METRQRFYSSLPPSPLPCNLYIAGIRGKCVTPALAKRTQVQVLPRPPSRPGTRSLPTTRGSRLRRPSHLHCACAPAQVRCVEVPVARQVEGDHFLLAALLALERLINRHVDGGGAFGRVDDPFRLRELHRRRERLE